MTRSRELSLKFDTSVYPLDAIQAASYTFTDRLSVRIERKGKGAVSVRLILKAAGGDLEALSGEFENELLHETLRLKVSLANQKIREFIVTKALVSAQVPSAIPSISGEAGQPCPDCEAGAGSGGSGATASPAVDAELEKEIAKLLTEIEKGGGAEDPLGVAVSWEDKYGAKAGKKGRGEGKVKSK